MKIQNFSDFCFFSNLKPHSKSNITVFAQAQGLHELKEEKKKKENRIH